MISSAILRLKLSGEMHLQLFYLVGMLQSNMLKNSNSGKKNDSDGAEVKAKLKFWQNFSDSWYWIHAELMLVEFDDCVSENGLIVLQLDWYCARI